MKAVRFHEVIISDNGSPIVLYRSTVKGGAECYLRLINGREFKGKKPLHREVVTALPRQLGILNNFVFGTIN